MATPQDEINALKAKIEQQLKSNALSAQQVANQTASYNAISGSVNELERYRTLFKDISVIIDDVADSLDFMTKSFMADVAHLTKGKSLLNDHKSAMSKLANIAKETLDVRLGEQAIDERRFKKLQEQARKQIDILKSVRDQYITDRKNTSEIQAQIDTTENLYKGFSKVEEINKKLNKQLGVAPKLVAGIDKAFQKLGLPDLGFSTALDETKQLGQEAAAQGDEAFKKFSPMKTLTGKIWDNFKGMFTTANILQASIGLFIEALIKGDTATGDLAKTFNITYDSATNIREELIEIGNISGNVALNARVLQESMVAIGQALGSNAKLNKEDLITFTELREMAGYTNEELVGIQKLTLATGGNLKDNTKQFLGTVSALNAQNKLTINEKQLLKEVANTSASIKLSVGGTTKGLAEAAFQAKQFGINLEQADRIAEGLLDFESSIVNELSAELITGKNINLEKARLLALNNDIAGASAEILKQVGGTAEFTKMNRIQQEATAKAVGMSREDLAASLIEREALSKLGVKDAAAAKAKFDLLVKEKGYAAAVAELGDEQYANQLKQQSIQERFNQSVEKLKEIFISIAEPVLKIISPIVDILIPAISTIPLLLQPVFDIFNGISGILTGGWDKLNGWTKTMGVIGLAAAGILITTKAISFWTGRKLFFDGLIYEFGIAQLALEGAKKQGIFGTIGAMVVALGVQMGILSASMATNAAVTFGIGVAVAVAAALAGIAAIRSVATKPAQVSDGEINSSGGLVVSKFEKGQLQPVAQGIKEDNVIFTTNKVKQGSSTSQTSQQDLSPLLEEMRALRQEQSRSNSKPIIVDSYTDSTKTGTATAMRRVKIQ